MRNLPPRQAAAYLTERLGGYHVSLETFRRWARDGRIEAQVVTPSGRRLYSTTYLDSLVQRIPADSTLALPRGGRF
jgi:predicted site-specific integrase-resolvase